MAAARTIRFANGFSMTLAFEGNRFLGIGEVRLKDVRRSGQEAILLFTSEGRWLPRLQAADAMGDARIATRSVKRPVARFRWTCSPAPPARGSDDWNTCCPDAFRYAEAFGGGRPVVKPV